jgi:hypothetical protein
MGFFYLMKNTGQIVRSKKTGKSRYTPINNDILQSQELTPEEKTILIYLLSLPEDWVVIKTHLINWANFGRDAFNNAWKGLIEKGYVVSVRVIDTKTHQFKGWNHVVYEEPVLDETEQVEEPELLETRKSESPKLGKSESRENRNSENQSVYKELNEESNNLTKDTFVESNNNTNGGVVVNDFNLLEIFNECWKVYCSFSDKQPGSKEKARKKFLTITPEQLETLRGHLPKFLMNHQRAKKIEYLPHFVTYLNQKRYEDEKMPYPDKVAEFENNLNNWYKDDTF